MGQRCKSTMNIPFGPQSYELFNLDNLEGPPFSFLFLVSQHDETTKIHFRLVLKTTTMVKHFDISDRNSFLRSWLSFLSKAKDKV